MRTAEVREKFKQFFEGKNHLALPSYSLIPHDDPSLLFTVAGMAPFKPYFLGATPTFAGHEGVWPRVTTAQKCIRVGDIENVGRTNRHQTFFEMLGNFSFGDYFKKEAIEWAWEFLTDKKWLGLEKDRIYVTIYKDDDEAFEYWVKNVGVAPEKIHRFDADENFWPANAPTKGPNGPCGPCSEIYYDRGASFGTDTWADYYNTRESSRFVEIWNLVFPQFNRSGPIPGEGILEPLPKKNIDTGMGLTRVAAIMQGVEDFYSTDDFKPLIDEVTKLAGIEYQGPKSVSHRVIAEHARAVTATLSDGAAFSNTGRGYVVRRLLRRAVRHGYLLGLREPFMHKLSEKVAETLGVAYPEMRENLASVQRQILLEEGRFFETLDSGIKRLDSLLVGLRQGDVLAGEEAFKLYDTYGFPMDLTLEIASERGISVDTEGFEKALAEQQERARAGMSFSKEVFKKTAEALENLAKQEGATEFTGYSSTEEQAEVKLMLLGEETLEEAPKGTELDVVLSKTPFYAEGGGQIGDFGILEWEGGWAKVATTQKNADGIFLHRVKVEEGTLKAGEKVRALVDARRSDTERNHTATHLLHAALRAVLGTHVKQAGSLVAPDRLRFDFTQPEPVSKKDLEAIELLVNRWIQADFPVSWSYKPIEQAKKEGAMALFGEKYADTVRVVTVEGSVDNVSSMELCGGCHVRRTGEIGVFIITSEEAVSAGVRRIEAVTGEGAVRFVRQHLAHIGALAESLGVSAGGLAERIRRLQEELKSKDREFEKLKMDLARARMGGGGGPVLRTSGELSYLALALDGLDPGSLRNAADELLEKYQADLVAVGSAGNLVLKLGKKALDSRLEAGALLKKISQTAGGRGGGKGALAQGGGFDLDKAFEALEGALKN